LNVSLGAYAEEYGSLCSSSQRAMRQTVSHQAYFYTVHRSTDLHGVFILIISISIIAIDVMTL
jgi:hypothetical protein